MKKAIVVLALACLLAVPLATTVGAGIPQNFIDFREKNPSDWSVIPGAVGQLRTARGNQYFFAASGLTPQTWYVLVNYYEDWPNVIRIAYLKSDRLGNIRAFGVFPDLEYHYYSPTDPGDYQDITGAKIWLVEYADYNPTDGTLVWSPSGWLFEMNLLLP
jgi:hypothetical protein